MSIRITQITESKENIEKRKEKLLKELSGKLPTKEELKELADKDPYSFQTVLTTLAKLLLTSAELDQEQDCKITRELVNYSLRLIEKIPYDPLVVRTALEFTGGTFVDICESALIGVTPHVSPLFSARLIELLEQVDKPLVSQEELEKFLKTASKEEAEEVTNELKVSEADQALKDDFKRVVQKLLEDFKEVDSLFFKTSSLKGFRTKYALGSTVYNFSYQKFFWSEDFYDIQIEKDKNSNWWLLNGFLRFPYSIEKIRALFEEHSVDESIINQL